MDTYIIYLIFAFLIFVVLLSVFMGWIASRSKKPKIRHEIGDKLEQFHARYEALDSSMETLFREHQVIGSITDAYRLIPGYVICKNEDELNHCKQRLVRLYGGAYDRYDDERTKP